MLRNGWRDVETANSSSMLARTVDCSAHALALWPCRAVVKRIPYAGNGLMGAPRPLS